jgi:hypothetical protein
LSYRGIVGMRERRAVGASNSECSERKRGSKGG